MCQWDTFVAMKVWTRSSCPFDWRWCAWELQLGSKSVDLSGDIYRWQNGISRPTFDRSCNNLHEMHTFPRWRIHSLHYINGNITSSVNIERPSRHNRSKSKASWKLYWKLYDPHNQWSMFRGVDDISVIAKIISRSFRMVQRPNNAPSDIHEGYYLGWWTIRQGTCHMLLLIEKQNNICYY